MNPSLSLRRSARLLKLPTAARNDCSDFPDPATTVPLPSALVKKRKVSSDNSAASASSEVRRWCLPRKRESQIKATNSEIRHIVGIDEAGRGPLAGPVVAAAVIVPTDIAGVVDSKKIVQETERELLYEAIIASPRVRWAVAVVDAATIDDINILQATLLGMRMAAQTVVRETPKEIKCRRPVCRERGATYRAVEPMPTERRSRHSTRSLTNMSTLFWMETRYRRTCRAVLNVSSRVTAPNFPSQPAIG